MSEPETTRPAPSAQSAEPLAPSGDGPGPAATGPTRDDLGYVWDTHTDEQYRRDMSHWRGHGRWGADVWSAIGVNTRKQLFAAAAMQGRDVPRGPLLEWGPGGGSNLVALARLASRVYAADVSPRNLAESARVVGELADAPRFTPIVVGDDPAAVATEVDELIELFVSTAVFQHFPSREYGAVVLNTVASLLAPDAIGCIQIRYDDGGAKYAQKTTQDYRRQHVTYTSYPLHEFWDLLVAAGLRPLGVTAIGSDTNYATFTFVPA